ncbi:cytochrome-c peroxidase [Xanthobacter versatilis]|uniref:cytochrome-c peroxidase n=1 Tax=Xanthobacter autotrophicus (strain ATCC BAA-1158 / Py2) TaxID=78245 RepID=UPI003726C233
MIWDLVTLWSGLKLFGQLSKYDMNVQSLFLSVCVILLLGGSHLAPAEILEVDWSPSDLKLLKSFVDQPTKAADETSRLAQSPNAVKLGRALFFDKKLSYDGTISCADCHNPGSGWTDGRQVAIAHGRRGKRNSLSLFNVAHFRWFSWDGRAETLWGQIMYPLVSPDEMGLTDSSAFDILCDDDYKHLVEASFGIQFTCNYPMRVGASIAYLAKALAAFVSEIRSGDTPFDRFARGVLSGDARFQHDMSASAINGYRVFVGKGRCNTCHRGYLFSDSEFHDIGIPPVFSDYSKDSGRSGGIDLVLSAPFRSDSELSGNPGGDEALRLRYLKTYAAAWGQFRTPSLREVAKTGPYMHEGGFSTLEEVVEFYSTRSNALRAHVHSESLLSPRFFSESEKYDLVEFLKSLSSDDLKYIPPRSSTDGNNN